MVSLTYTHGHKSHTCSQLAREHKTMFFCSIRNMLATMSATHHCFVLQCNKNEKAKTRQNFLQWLQARQGQGKKKIRKRAQNKNSKTKMCAAALSICLGLLAKLHSLDRNTSRISSNVTATVIVVCSSLGLGEHQQRDVCASLLVRKPCHHIFSLATWGSLLFKPTSL